MSWTSEDLKYKMCKLQEFGILSGLHFFPWYTEFVWSAQSSILFVIYVFTMKFVSDFLFYILF